MDFKGRYSKLNAAQKQAVDHIDGPLMVVAGPGTGKTELLSVRIANILSKTDTLPENILCLTFTDNGAAAMRERLIGIIGKDAYKVAIHTFHSFGTEVINQHREYFYNGALFQPADDLSRYQILRGIFEELDYKNPLASTMNGEYTHQSDVTTVISQLKRSGLTSDELLKILDANEAAMEQAEKLLMPILDATVKASMGDALRAALTQLQEMAEKAETEYEVVPLIRVIVDSLAATLAQTADHPTKPITAWKKKWLEKNAQKELVFKSHARLEKLRASAYIYFEYLSRLEKAGLYDYDDMILQVVHAMEVNDDLRANLQEKFLYIMVDEFQDTNLAQMRILHNLTDSPVNEGEPNLMVVGDDDQAIYSFQGADISNILRFQELYPTAGMISLTNNYRSGATVIEKARGVITQAEERLEWRIKELDKNLSAEQSYSASVDVIQAPSAEQERAWIVRSISEQLQQGTQASDIVVLARKHHEIQSLLPFFAHAGIAVSYERQENILDQAPIVALELIAKTVLALSQGRHGDVNALLPELLAHPAWGIAPKDLWKLSLKAYDGRQHWMEIMENTPEFVTIHSWLIELAALAPHEQLEPMLDRLIGRPQDDTEKPGPFYQYYFNDTAREKDPSQYLDYLVGIRTLRRHLRDFRTQHEPTLASLMEFVQLHRQLGTQLLISRDTGDTSDAVRLMSAHAAKGLEFHTVYIYNATDAMWGEKARARARLIHYPENLPLAPAGDTLDERLRLFYVAMTRAKQQLFISYADQNDGDKATLVASFLAGEPSSSTPTVSLADTTAIAETAWYEPLSKVTTDLHELLAPTLKKYKLSATHLTAFLDIACGGPQNFLLNNLLHFPSTKSAAASYGSAIHNTLQQAQGHLLAKGEHKPVEDVLRDFEASLSRERLTEQDFTHYLQKGSEQLPIFLASPYAQFNTKQVAELNFAGQEVHIGDAHITGIIDLATIDKQDRTFQVADYKTGKPAESWKGKDEYEKIKLYHYRQQLLFYKLLVENSRDYGTYSVEMGKLLFVEPSRSGQVHALDLVFDKEEVERVNTLIQAVWVHIQSLDLPDTTAYPETLKGIQQFEQDLIDSFTS